MSVGLILLVTLIYGGVTVCEYMDGRYGMALAFAGYAVANIGLIWAIKVH